MLKKNCDQAFSMKLNFSNKNHADVLNKSKELMTSNNSFFKNKNLNSNILNQSGLVNNNISNTNNTNKENLTLLSQISLK